MKSQINLQAVRILMWTELNDGDPDLLDGCLADIKNGIPFDLDIGVEGLRIKWDSKEEAFYLCEYTADELKTEETAIRFFARMASTV